MVEELAKVIGYHDGWVEVEVTVKTACGHCDNQDSCGTSAVSKAFSPKVQRFSLPSESHYQPGQTLRLGLPESVLLQASALIYLSPLVGLFIGAFIGPWLAALFGFPSSEALTISCAALLSFATWRLAKAKAKQMEAGCQPVILGLVVSSQSL